MLVKKKYRQNQIAYYPIHIRVRIVLIYRKELSREALQLGHTAAVLLQNPDYSPMLRMPIIKKRSPRKARKSLKHIGTLPVRPSRFLLEGLLIGMTTHPINTWVTRSFTSLRLGSGITHREVAAAIAPDNLAAFPPSLAVSRGYCSRQSCGIPPLPGGQCRYCIRPWMVCSRAMQEQLPRSKYLSLPEPRRLADI